MNGVSRLIALHFHLLCILMGAPIRCFMMRNGREAAGSYQGLPAPTVRWHSTRWGQLVWRRVFNAIPPAANSGSLPRAGWPRRTAARGRCAAPVLENLIICRMVRIRDGQAKTSVLHLRGARPHAAHTGGQSGLPRKAHLQGVQAGQAATHGDSLNAWWPAMPRKP